MALLVTKTRKTQSGLTATAVLLGQIDRKFVDNFASIARDRAKEGAITVHDDEAELRVGLQQFLQRFRMELVVT